MIRIDRICVWLLIINTLFMMVMKKYAGFLDEMVCYSMGGLIVADCIFNKRWREYSLLWTILGVLTFYAVFSLLFRHYNTRLYIIYDYLMFIKPFLPISAFIGMKASLTYSERTILKWAALLNIFMASLCIPLGVQLSEKIFFNHILFQGLSCMTSVLIYIWCSSQDNDGILTRRNILIIILSLLVGLYCQRSKYYGEFIVILFMLFIYRPGIFSKISPRSIMIFFLLSGIILAAVWKKLAYYYIYSDFSTDLMDDNGARLSLMYGMLMILSQYPLFGAGLASFGTLPSAWNYSDLYYELNLNVVWGLSPSKYDFIADNFIATLGGQFGLVGIALFISLLVYFYKSLAPLRLNDYPAHRYSLIVGIMVIVDIAIENTSGNVLFSPPGITQLSLLGLIISQAKSIKTNHEDNSSPLPTDRKKDEELPQVI